MLAAPGSQDPTKSFFFFFHYLMNPPSENLFSVSYILHILTFLHSEYLYLLPGHACACIGVVQGGLEPLLVELAEYLY